MTNDPDSNHRAFMNTGLSFYILQSLIMHEFPSNNLRSLRALVLFIAKLSDKIDYLLK